MIALAMGDGRRLVALGCVLCLGVPQAADAAGENSAAALHSAVRLNDAAAVERIGRDHKTLLDAAGENGITPLSEAVRWGHARIYTLLIEHGADVDRGDHDGRGALHYAAMADEPDALRALIAAGADVDARDHYRYTALHMAAREGHEEAVRLLVAAGAELNARIDVGYTAIDLAQSYPSVQDYLRHRGGESAADLE